MTPGTPTGRTGARAPGGLIPGLIAQHQNLRATTDAFHRDVMANRVAVRDRGPRVTDSRLAVVTNVGPGGEGDLAGNEYWLKFQALAEDEEGIYLADETKAGIAGTVRAMHLGEPSDSHSLATNETVYVRAQRFSQGTAPTLTLWTFTTAQRSGVFTVALELGSPPGDNGTDTTPPTYVYDVHDEDTNELLGSAMAPERPRTNGLVTVATAGYAKYGPSGIRLLEAWETQQTQATGCAT